MTEQQAIRDAVSALTGADFEISRMEDVQPNRGLHPIWYIHCPEITQLNKIPYVESLWKEGKAIRIESLTLGNTSELLELAYGEEAVISVMNTDLTNFGDKRFRGALLGPFPLVKQRLDGYEEITKRVSKRSGTRLGITYDGDKGLVTLYLNAIIEEGGIELVITEIEKALRGLKEAYREIKALDRAGQND